MNTAVNVTDMMRRAKEINNRLWNPPKKVAQPLPVVEAAPEPRSRKPIGSPWFDKKPLWSWTEVHFDAHVMAWRKQLDADPHFATKQEIQCVLDGTQEYKKPLKEIVAEVLTRHPGVTWADVLGKHRRVYVVNARHECMFEVFKQRADMSYPLIGRLFGGRDHTTVISAVKKMKAREAAR